MKNKITLLSGGLLCLTLMIAHGQTATTSATVKGTPYIDEAYVDGVIYYADKTHAAPIRYNAYQDLIEYQQNGKALVLDPNLLIKKVQVGDAAFVPLKYQAEGKSKVGYFAVLDSGKITLLSKKTIVFSAAQKGRAMDGGDLPAQYKTSPDAFYYKIGDGELQEVTSIKAMIAAFPDKQEELTTFAKKEKISPRKEKEMIELVKYYNSL
ncbi:MAG TPA: hypothetical protein VK666_08210 [Chryseolinea sp.]|nr:hypothetical protein [Chryseolinea sp.]